MEETKYKFDLASFKKSNDAMIATSDSAYQNTIWGLRNRGTRIKEYDLEKIDRIINAGDINQQIELSRNYFFKDGFYKRIILYYATLLKFAGVLIPNPAQGKNLSDPSLQKRYYNAMNFIERTHLNDLLTHCSVRALRDGCYYGVIQNNDTHSFALLDLPISYCTTRFKDSFGNDIVEFNVSYFNTITDEAAREQALEIYPSIVKKHYRRYTKGKVTTPWVMIPSDIGVCFPMMEGRPMFLNVIPATIQYDQAVETEQEREKEEIKKIIVQKIPHLNDGGLLFEPEEALEIHRGTVGMMKKNDNVSVLTTYADVDAITSRGNTEAANNVLEKMVQNIYSEGGVSSQLFAATGSMSIEISIRNDTALMMMLANKYSKCIGNLVNKLFANNAISFKYTILPITYYNESSYITDSFKLAQSGYSFILPALALGFSQRDLGNIKELESKVLNLEEKLKPLASAYTQSAASQKNDADGEGKEGEAGRPTKKDEDKSPNTISKEKSIDKQGGSK